MILKLLFKPGRYKPLVEADELVVSPGGISGASRSPALRDVLIVPQSTLIKFQLMPGDLRENVVIDDSSIGPLHDFPSGTVLELGAVLVRLTVHCEPCGRLKDVVSIRAIEHQRGYLGMFLTAGKLRVGDSVRSLGTAHEAIPYGLKERVAWYLQKQQGPVEVTKLVDEIGLSLSYCRTIPNLLRSQPDLLAMVTFRGRALRRVRLEGERQLDAGDPGAEATRAAQDTQAQSVEFIPGAFVVHLKNESSFTVPLESMPQLMQASPDQRCCWELTDYGMRIRWPMLDLEIATAALLGLPE